MESLLKHPEALIASAIAEAKKWNVTGYNVDMEAPSPVGDDALAVVAFVNKLSAALAAHGVKTSYCKPAPSRGPAEPCTSNPRNPLQKSAIEGRRNSV